MTRFGCHNNDGSPSSGRKKGIGREHLVTELSPPRMPKEHCDRNYPAQTVEDHHLGLAAKRKADPTLIAVQSPPKPFRNANTDLSEEEPIAPHEVPSGESQSEKSWVLSLAEGKTNT
ncbi:hypothetical protein EAE96_010734 [Botrytis aclada]|nr:hypothetical protein EAE96_010734 [Botrytis aclada]